MEEERRRLRRNAREIGKLIGGWEQARQGNRGTLAEKLAETPSGILGIEDHNKAGATAALVLMLASAQTCREHTGGPEATLRHWEHIMMTGSKLRFLPIIPLALRIARTLPRGLLGEVTEMARIAAPWAKMQHMGRGNTGTGPQAAPVVRVPHDPGGRSPDGPPGHSA